jgi:hypothetical protein
LRETHLKGSSLLFPSLLFFVFVRLLLWCWCSFPSLHLPINHWLRSLSDLLIIREQEIRCSLVFFIKMKKKDNIFFVSFFQF